MTRLFGIRRGEQKEEYKSRNSGETAGLNRKLEPGGRRRFDKKKQAGETPAGASGNTLANVQWILYTHRNRSSAPHGRSSGVGLPLKKAVLEWRF